MSFSSNAIVSLPDVNEIMYGVPRGQTDIEWCTWQQLPALRAHDAIPILLDIPVDDYAITKVVTNLADDLNFDYLGTSASVMDGDCFFDDRLKPIEEPLMAMAAVITQLGAQMQGIEVFRSSIEWESGAPWHFDGGGKPENRAGLLVPRLAELTEVNRLRYATQYAINIEAVERYAGDARLLGNSATKPENKGIVDPKVLSTRLTQKYQNPSRIKAA